MKKYIKILWVVLFLLLLGTRVESDDKELFIGANVGANIVKPNVVVLMDSSTSMNSIIQYPKYGVDKMPGTADDGFDPLVTYTGTLGGFSDGTPSWWEAEATRWVGRWYKDGTVYSPADPNGDGGNSTHIFGADGATKFQVGSNGWNYFTEGETIMAISYNGTHNDAVCTLVSKWQDTSGNWFEVGDIKGGPIIASPEWKDITFQRRDESYQSRIVQLYGTTDPPNDNNAGYYRNYLKWLYIHASDAHRDAVSHFSTYGTFDTSKTPGELPSSCVTPGHDRIKQTFTRIQTAREVICRVATFSNEIVNLGLFKFDGSDGGYKLDDVTPSNDLASDLVAYKNMVADIEASGFTPLAETLADIWNYYKPGPVGGKDYWPTDEYSSVHDIQYWCQNNYVIVMTDGESTQDQFSGDTRFSGSIFNTYPVKRSESWADWSDGWGDADNNEASSGRPADYDPAAATYCPNWSCWKHNDTELFNGSDYLDDVAYFINHQDLFPEFAADGTELYGDDPVTGWPGDQKIFTYTIGFNIDSDLLRETAINGDGAYYTANDYEQLVEAFQNIITSILLRNFAFSAITAPKKTATAMNDELTTSYVGYFMPSGAASIWEGHLLAYELQDKWGYDADNSGEIGSEEYVFDTQADCQDESEGQECRRQVKLSGEHAWDAATKIPASRRLYSHDQDTTLIPFNLTDTNPAVFVPLFNSSEPEAIQIMTRISAQQLGDIFHADVVFVGPPHEGKKYMTNIDPLDPDGESYETYAAANQSRRRVLYSGSNDGILHMFYADSQNAGQEVWGFIPDEVLPSLKTIVIDGDHTYTVDGRIFAEDVYFTKGGGSYPEWTTLLVFGLRAGGNAYYALDVTSPGTQPTILWKFKDSTHSGQSWGKPAIGKIKVGDGSGGTTDKWVVVLAGGFAFNNENTGDLQGKAVFIVDAATGDLLWMIGYDPTNGATDDAGTDKLETTSSDTVRYLTQDAVFNYPIPSSLVAVDRDSDSFIDTLYFGNTGGHLFKTDISALDKANWETSLLYKADITTVATGTITDISGTEFTVSGANNFTIGHTIMGQSSFATGYITDIGGNKLTVWPISGTFQAETFVTRSWDPLFISPAVAYDSCYQLWVIFGTGDRDRPRTSTTKGRFIAVKDNGGVENQLGTNLQQLTWSGTDNETLTSTTVTGNSINGWYFNFPDDYEKLFDPEPLILPDENFIPHIYFNTYQPPADQDYNPQDNPCDVPGEGMMSLYDIILSGCGPLEDTVEGTRQSGRIAGGGVYQGSEYVQYVGYGEVASVPPLEDTKTKKFPYPGGVVFWKENKR